jgi:UDP-glucose 4-epimerase
LVAKTETLLVTGAAGFIMSHVARQWLERSADGKVLAIDAAALDDQAARFFAPVADRLEFVQADILDQALWSSLDHRNDVGAIVHGATVTSIDGLVHAECRGRPGLSGAREPIKVNIDGTLNVLQWATARPQIRRLVNVSSGSVYASQSPDPLPEDGFVDPAGIYAISKHAGELFTDYASKHLELPAVSVRLSGVFGPMDRETPSRAVRSAPRVIAELGLEGKPVRLRSLKAAGDFVHAGDVAKAIIALLDSESLRYPVYNIAAGKLTTISELIEMLRHSIPSLRFEEVGDQGQADLDQDPRLHRGRFGAYDISRLRQDTGWAPRPMQNAVGDYVAWLRG